MRTWAASPLARRAALWLFSSPALLSAPAALRAARPPDPASGVATRSGLRYIDFREGAGQAPRYGQLIRFHYVGYALKDGGSSIKMFDSSYERNAPYFTKHGNGYTCQGIEEALHTMRPGGRRRVVLPANLGFEIGDKGPLPPGPGQRDTLFDAVAERENLVYDLELLSVMDDLLDRGDYEDLDVDEAKVYMREQSTPRTAAELGDGPMGQGN